MRIAIIGSGISGMTAAYYWRNAHEVTVFEANSYIGGHTNTIDVEEAGKTIPVDTGFIVCNDRTYPNFLKLLQEINIEYQPTGMTFSVQCEASGIEYRGADLNGLFAQRRNLFRPAHYGLLSEMLRFNRQVERLLEPLDPDISVGEFFRRHSFRQSFREHFFLPMASAIWSCPNSTVEQFPMRFIVEFYRHHGLLSVNDRPQWYVIKGGSQTYMRALAPASLARIHINTPIVNVLRSADEVVLTTRAGEQQSFDHVLFACHSDQALRILGSGATASEREILGAFPYEKNIAVLHRDHRVLPQNRRAWACWNYFLPQTPSAKATVTYNMNLLQGLKTRHTYCVSLNCEERIAPQSIIQRIEYEHPIFTTERRSAQQRHPELIGPNRSSFAGAYWGNGFHEDGVVSALAVCEGLKTGEFARGSHLAESAS
ncbi:MAG: FAD-dependent oxidoreductase [Pirellulaceae bacterium]|nr:FAD-dependent oxidoreductase [Pirellulaceae bacterium]